MNKTGFIKEIAKQTNLTENESILVDDILEDIPVVGVKNKEKIISELIKRLNVTEERAEEIYNIVSSIITTQIKEKIKHPFKS